MVMSSIQHLGMDLPKVQSLKVQSACEAFRRGCNCAQAVLSVFAPSLGLPAEQAMRLACGFGGGMRMGETCGAVTGAIMVLGLRHGNCAPQDQQSKQNTYKRVPELIRQFRHRHGTICCKELLGYDLSDPRALAQAKAMGLLSTVCPEFVTSAIEIVESMTPAFSVADV